VGSVGPADGASAAPRPHSCGRGSKGQNEGKKGGSEGMGSCAPIEIFKIRDIPDRDYHYPTGTGIDRILDIDGRIVRHIDN